MAAAIVHDCGRAREFTYGAEFGLSEEGRLLGHLAIGAELVGAAAGSLPEQRRLALLACVLSHHGPDAGPARGRGGAGFPSAEALALYRLNALDAVGQGRARARASALNARRRNCTATNTSKAANARAPAPARRSRWRPDADQHPEWREGREDEPVADANVAVAVLAPGADHRDGDDRQQRRRLGTDLGLVEEDDERRHEQDPAPDAEQPADRPAGEPEQRGAHVLHQPITSCAATRQEQART